MKKLLFLVLLLPLTAQAAFLTEDETNGAVESDWNMYPVYQDDATAVYWYEWHKMIAEEGNAEAQYVLGIMHARGRGVEQDRTTAKSWFGMACTNGIDDGCKYYEIFDNKGY